MTLRPFKCTHVRKRTLDFSLECIQLFQNVFFKQRYITFNATIPGQDIIIPNTHVCRTFLLGIYRTVFEYVFIPLPFFCDRPMSTCKCNSRPHYHQHDEPRYDLFCFVLILV